MAVKLFLTLSKIQKFQMPNIKKLHGEWSELHTKMKLSYTFCSQDAGITIGSTCILCGKKQETHTEFCGEIY
jgi:hypothetical protein